MHWPFLPGLFLWSFLAAAAWAQGPTHTLRFSDTPTLRDPTSHDSQGVRLHFPEVTGPEAPVKGANDWLLSNHWKQVWPLKILGKGVPLFFAGPPTQRYLRIATKGDYFIWARPLDVDPQLMPYVAITWGIEYFPDKAALDIHKRNDRPLAILLSFGPKVSTGGLLPDVPRGLALFWGETETIGKDYTCIPARQGPPDRRLQCNYPHVKYIGVRRGGAGTTHTDVVNILELFQQHFPDYVQEQQRVPAVVGVSFEAGSDLTDSASSARLYSLHFMGATSGAALPVMAR